MKSFAKRVALHITIVSMLLCALASTAFAQITNCDRANPFDQADDTIELQACLDDPSFTYVALQPNHLPGYVGYIISDTLRFRRSGLTLSSNDRPFHQATIIAAPSLAVPMLRATNSSNWEISFIVFDGNRYNRTSRFTPCVGEEFNNIIVANNRAFHFFQSASVRSLCSSAFTVEGDNSGYELDNTYFYDNGAQPEDAGGISGLWADGLTVYGCDGSNIHDNTLDENTDVGLGVNGGSGCTVYRNHMHQYAKYAFAEFVIGDRARQGGDWGFNEVVANPDKAGFGILIGVHRWDQNNWSPDVGRVHDNSSFGAVVPFAIDGILNGVIETSNVFGTAQGSRLLVNCSLSANYTAGDFGTATIPPNPITRTYHGGSCQ